MKEKTIFFDLDGTLVDLYGVDDWLSKLRNFDASPYKDASPLIDIQELEDILTIIQSMGIKVSVLSALAKVSNDTYDKEVKNAKIDWINNHFTNFHFDSIIIIPYDSPKELYGNDSDVIFDDSQTVRDNWCGVSYDVNNIIDDLKALIK